MGPRHQRRRQRLLSVRSEAVVAARQRLLERTVADVSAGADPSTGVAVYTDGLWGVYGGTSAASPIIASVYALAGHPAAGSNAGSYPYLAATGLYDVVGGNNDVTWKTCGLTSYLCNGVAGYDGPTGLGTPNGVRAFAVPTVPGKPTGVTATASDASAGLAWTAPVSDGGRAITGYTVTETEHGLGVVPCTPITATTCTVHSLTNGTEYTFTVHATNSVGNGPESDPSNKVTPVAQTVPGNATHLSVSGLASPRTSGTTGSLTVAALDSSGNAATGYLGTVHFTSTDSLAVLPTDYTFTGADNGTHVFSVTLKTNGAQSVTATDTGTSSITGTQANIMVLTFTGATYHSLGPTRILDSRIPLGDYLFSSQVKQNLNVVGSGAGVPSGAVAVTGNVTVVGETASGYVSLAPSLTSYVEPGSSTINFPLGDTRANGVTVPLSGSGTLDIMYWTGSPGPTVNVIFDVTGYFAK